MAVLQSFKKAVCKTRIIDRLRPYPKQAADVAASRPEGADMPTSPITCGLH